MSTFKAQGNASGTGEVTLQTPNTNTNRTISLPDATTTLVGTDATQTLTNKTTTTETNGDNSTKLATTAYVQNMSVGWGQTYQNVTGSRSSGATYTNSTGKPIFVFVTVTNTLNIYWTIYVDSVQIGDVNGYGTNSSCFFIVPPGSTYSVDTNGLTIMRWFELR